MAYLPGFINPQQYVSPGGTAGLSQLYAEEAQRRLSPVREPLGPEMCRTTAGPGIEGLQSPLGRREFLQGLEGPQITAGERSLNQLLLGGQYPQQLLQAAQPIPLPDIIPTLIEPTDTTTVMPPPPSTTSPLTKPQPIISKPILKRPPIIQGPYL